jgi:hypothetical protein
MTHCDAEAAPDRRNRQEKSAQPVRAPSPVFYGGPKPKTMAIGIGADSCRPYRRAMRPLPQLKVQRPSNDAGRTAADDPGYVKTPTSFLKVEFPSQLQRYETNIIHNIRQEGHNRENNSR